MASAYDLSNEILRRFVDSQRNEMTLADLHRSLAYQNHRLTADEVFQTIRSPSLVNLFNLQSITNQHCAIRLNPKLVLCEECLQRRCRTKNCSLLHLCCFPDHFIGKDLPKKCTFPHKLSELPNNVILLKKFNYERLDEDLLLDLLRLHRKTSHAQMPAAESAALIRPSSSSSDRPPSMSAEPKAPAHRLRRPRPSPQMKKSPVQSTVRTDNVTERQLDVSIPSETQALDVDLEIVQLVLATKDIHTERILDTRVSNDCYRRYTLQFKDRQGGMDIAVQHCSSEVLLYKETDEEEQSYISEIILSTLPFSPYYILGDLRSEFIVENILRTEPVIIYNNIDIKMKRTARRRDPLIFALKFSTAEKINGLRLNLYVETLVGKAAFHIMDMTPHGSDQQIHLIRCEQPIDFDHVYKIHSGKNTLQSCRVTIAEIYEAETLEVSFVPGTSHLPMSYQRLRKLFGEARWQRDVFACIKIHDNDSADIELMNTEVTAAWLADAPRIEHELSLVVRPVLDFIQPADKKDDEDDEVAKLLAVGNISPSPSPASVSTDSPKRDSDAMLYHIKPDWRIVLTHPTFGAEYRNYIRENMNFLVRITGSAIEVPNEGVRKELARYTNMFVQKFAFREVVAPNKAQVKMIKENYARMAHKWIKDTNKTIVAARREVLNELFPSSGPVAQLASTPVATPTFRSGQLPNPHKQVQPVTPLMEMEPLSPPPIKPTEEDLVTLPYSIGNNVYLPFFAATNSFPDRLKSYLSTTFHTLLDFKFTSATNLVLELKGRKEDVMGARSMLTSLFGLLKTKIYADSKDSCKFAIPDVYRVAQWTLEQNGIVSSCSYSPRNGGSLTVRYFAENSPFSTDEQSIEDQIFENLHDISYEVSTTSPKLELEMEELQKSIQRRPNYGQEICCWFDGQKASSEKTRSPRFYLCGLKTVVVQIYQEVRNTAEKNIPVPCSVPLPPNQAANLLQFCSAELIKIEKEYEAAGVDLRSRLNSGSTSQFVAPRYLHEKMKLVLLELNQMHMLSKESDLPARKPEHYYVDSVSPSLPSRRKAPDPVAPAPNKVSSGTINISNGDLRTEPADVLVICPSSEKLYTGIVHAAGKEVASELKDKDLGKVMVDTSAGQLKQAKRLLFVPWTPPNSDDPSGDLDSIQQSIGKFVQQAMKFAIQGKHTSIAFPAVGCGGFGIPASVIATYMIDAVRRQLAANPSSPLTVTFVIQQPNVYDAFCTKLKPMPAATTGRGHPQYSFRSPTPED